MDALDPALPPQMVVDRLAAEVRQLVTVNRELYAGRWDDFAEDLRRRQAGRPYLYRVSLDLEDPLDWIRRLKEYEMARGETLVAGAT